MCCYHILLDSGKVTHVKGTRGGDKWAGNLYPVVMEELTIGTIRSRVDLVEWAWVKGGEGSKGGG